MCIHIHAHAHTQARDKEEAKLREVRKREEAVLREAREREEAIVRAKKEAERKEQEEEEKVCWSRVLNSSLLTCSRRGGKQTGAPWRPLPLRNGLTVVKNQKHKQPVVKSRGLCKRDPKPAKTNVWWL
jgi:hypothetical protein